MSGRSDRPFPGGGGFPRHDERHMRRLRNDLGLLVTVGLLGAFAVSAVTGVVADLWDLNDFWWHTVAGYVMGGLAIAHVVLNWDRLVGYARFRLVRRERRVAPPVLVVKRVDPDPAGPLRSLGRRLLSRRGLLAATAGGMVGVLLGRGLRPRPPIAAGSDVGVVYHEWSKPGLIDALGSVANWGQQPELYKTYPEAQRIALPAPKLDGSLPTSQAIVRRRSTRTYAPEPTSLDELSTILHLAAGITADNYGHPRRAAPSSGALYPIELYPVVHNVAGLERGVYHYAIREHALELVRAEDLRARIVEQGLFQEFLGQSGVVVFLTQILQRMRFKYQDRSYRYGLLEAGHIGENLYLAATALGLGACGVGAFMDDDINRMLGVDGTEEAAVYLVTIGKVPHVA